MTSSVVSAFISYLLVGLFNDGNGCANHRTPPTAMQLRSMLRGEEVKGNGKGQGAPGGMEGGSPS